MNRGSSGALAADGDFLRISSEGGNVISDPAECLNLVLEASISGDHVVTSAEETCEKKPQEISVKEGFFIYFSSISDL